MCKIKIEIYRWNRGTHHQNNNIFLFKKDESADVYMWHPTLASYFVYHNFLDLLLFLYEILQLLREVWCKFFESSSIFL